MGKNMVAVVENQVRLRMQMRQSAPDRVYTPVILRYYRRLS